MSDKRTVTKALKPQSTAFSTPQIPCTEGSPSCIILKKP